MMMEWQSGKTERYARVTASLYASTDEVAAPKTVLEGWARAEVLVKKRRWRASWQTKQPGEWTDCCER